MKPFRFKLEKVLDYRGQLEDQAKAALSRAKAAHDEQEALVQDIAARFEAHKAKQLEATKSPGDMWLWRQYRNALETDLAAARVRLRELALMLHKVREEAVRRSRDRKLLEKLKENQARKHYAEENLREQKENDEMATIRYERKDI
ncbi:flagellar export protein FliJ [Salidesulfovibrio onnuriiensis]|uniref:flagellar export protein FliJ n=1 Tax=Salidesulfovibrio onnuriiensis TaxID=2583823 RepID=UPI0011C9521D|nr:flagellar export protein FliJ [Salidesulfovibrio onnuriiensis]